MTGRVSDESLFLVETCINQLCRERGTTIIDDLTVAEFANKATVALATFHNAVKQLEEMGRLVVMRSPSRRFNHLYVYKSRDFGNRKILVEVAYINQLIDKINQLQKEVGVQR
jgi:predicted transcriptional regulator